MPHLFLRLHKCPWKIFDHFKSTQKFCSFHPKVKLFSQLPQKAWSSVWSRRTLKASSTIFTWSSLEPRAPLRIRISHEVWVTIVRAVPLQLLVASCVALEQCSQSFLCPRLGWPNLKLSFPPFIWPCSNTPLQGYLRIHFLGPEACPEILATGAAGPLLAPEQEAAAGCRQQVSWGIRAPPWSSNLSYTNTKHKTWTFIYLSPQFNLIVGIYWSQGNFKISICLE